MKRGVFILIASGLLLGCGRNKPTAPTPPTNPPPHSQPATQPKPPPLKPPAPVVRTPRNHRLVRVIVALCDNDHQGIAPVRAALGNGQSPRTNLYWGAMYGVKTFFSRSRFWTADPRRAKKLPPHVLAQAYFIHTPSTGKQVHVHTVAIDGQSMKTALEVFFGELANGHADMVCFVGHNGLMDTTIGPLPKANLKIPAIIFACQSDLYFRPLLDKLGSKLLVSTFGNMAPEAYILDATLRAWAVGKPESQLRNAAATAYDQYQSCSLRAAQRLFGAQ
jgi:hypothetical protein